MLTRHFLFDWGDTLMVDLPGQSGPMCDWPQIEVMPSALACLSQLSEVAICHLATNARDSNPQQIRHALQRAGLSPYLQHIFCYKTVMHDKSDPAFYAHIVNALQVPPEQITMVGDSLTKDVYPAMAQGIQAIWFNPQRQPCPPAIQTIYQLTDLGHCPKGWS